MTLTELIEASEKELVEAGEELASLKMPADFSPDHASYIAGGMALLEDVVRLLREVKATSET